MVRGSSVKAAIAAIALGCGQAAMEPGSLYGRAEGLFRGERFSEALERAREGEKRVPADSAWAWKFRVLEARVLLEQKETRAAAEALRAGSGAGNRGVFAVLEGQLADQRGGAGNYAAAHGKFDEAAAEARKSGDEALAAEVELRRGLLAIHEGRFEEAEGHLKPALDFANRHGDGWIAMRANGNLGFRRLRAHDYAGAIPYFEKARDEAARAGAATTEERALGNAATCYYNLGDLEKALVYYERALALVGAAGPRADRILWLNGASGVYMSQAEYGRAAEAYKRLVGAAREAGDRALLTMSLVNLAKASLLLDDLDTAERYNNEGAAIAKEMGRGDYALDAEMNRARIALSRARYAEAERIAAEVAGSAGATAFARAQAHNLTATALDGEGKTAAAEREFTTAIEVVEGARRGLRKDESRLSFLENLAGFYRDKIDFLMAKGRTAEALELADYSHARTMAEKLGESGGGRRGTAADFRRMAGESGGVLLEYSIGWEHSWMWVVTGSGIEAAALPRAKEIRGLVERWGKAIREESGEDEAGRRLYEVLAAPAAKWLRPGVRVTVAPDGALNGLNFETLVVGGEKPHYWIEDAEVAVAPSLGLLRGVEAEGEAGRRALLVGDAEPAGAEFPRLRFAGREMAAIGQSLAGYETTVLRGAEATPGAWAAVGPERFGVMHFAAHAVADRIEPLDSAVILSRRGGADYRLRAREIVKRRVAARLVTLSACRSAGTRIYSGEGLVGLSWAFLEAGARNAVAGLWDVDDEAGARVMEGLYEGIARGESPRAALRGAKLGLMRSGKVWGKPYYWGAFELFTTEAGARVRAVS